MNALQSNMIVIRMRSVSILNLDINVSANLALKNTIMKGNVKVREVNRANLVFVEHNFHQCRNFRY